MNTRTKENDGDSMSLVKTKEKKKKRNSLSRRLFILSLIIIPLAQFLVFYVFVNFNSILMAFQVVDHEKTIWSFKNYTMLFNEIRQPTSKFWISCRNTAIFFAQGLLTHILTGFIICYFLYIKIPGSKILRLLLFLPGMISSVVIALIFEMIVGEIGPGPIAELVRVVKGLDEVPSLLADSDYALKTLIFYNMWLGLAGNMVLYLGALNRIPKEVLESAQLDGVGWLGELFKIILPLIWPTMITLLTIQCAGMFTASGPIFLFTQGKYETYTISYWLFEKIYNMPVNSPQLNYGSAIGLFFTCIAVPVIMLIRHYLNKLQEAVEY